MSYESSLIAGWERYSADPYEGDVDVEDPCDECGAQPPERMMAVAVYESDRGEARWTCPSCGEENLIKLGWGYDDI